MKSIESSVSRPNRIKKVLTKFTAVGSLALLATGCIPSHEINKAEAIQHVKAAAAVAERFDCKAGSVQDLQDVNDRDGALRTTVRVTIQTPVAENAKQPLQDYADGTKRANDVRWDTPTVGAAIMEDGKPIADVNVSGIATDVLKQQSTNPMYPSELTADLFPLQEWANGSRAELFVQQRVVTSEGAEATGLMPCGFMQKENGTWRLDQTTPNDLPPLVEVH